MIFILGFKLLKEHITKRELLGIISMISGVILTSMYVSEKSTELNQGSMIFFSVIFIGLSILFISISLLKRDQKQDEYFLTIVSGILFSLGIIYNNAIYIYGSFSLTLEFLLFNPFVYFLIISYFFAFFIGQIAYARGRMVMTAPIANIIGMGLPILGGIFIFNEQIFVLFEGSLIFPLSFLKLIGIFLVLIGILIIFPKIKSIKETKSIL